MGPIATVQVKDSLEVAQKRGLPDSLKQVCCR
jgi:hypothetical protein